MIVSVIPLDTLLYNIHTIIQHNKVLISATVDSLLWSGLCFTGGWGL